MLDEIVNIYSQNSWINDELSHLKNLTKNKTSDAVKKKLTKKRIYRLILWVYSNLFRKEKRKKEKSPMKVKSRSLIKMEKRSRKWRYWSNLKLNRIRHSKIRRRRISKVIYIIWTSNTYSMIESKYLIRFTSKKSSMQLT